MFPAMNRYRAALTHFGISALVVGTVFVLVYFLWYPQPLFRGAGGRDLFVVLAMVDVTVGPLITLIIFKPGKKGLKFDLATIAVLQIAALAYGTHVVFEARPVWVVFLKDRFDLITALAGVDVSSYPQHYVPYEEVRGEVLAKAKPIRELRALNPGSGPEIDRLLRNLGREEAQVAFLPLRAGKSDLTVLVDAASGAVLQLVELRPWKY